MDYNSGMSYDFARELQRYGPEADYPAPSVREARQYCRSFTQSSYENFSVISILLEKDLVAHFQAVYSFCRWADDLGDQTGGGERSLQLLKWWREELDLCWKGTPHHPVFVALWPAIQQFHMPRELFSDLIFAFEQDQLITEYQTFEQLLGYCKCSANPVGRLVLAMWGCLNEKTGALSDQICTALQLTNFWQDVARDYDIGRIYLPLDVRLCHGYSPEDLRGRRENDAFREVLKDLVKRTEQMFDEGGRLLELVPSKRRVDLSLFIDGGLAILDKIRQKNYEVWRERPKLSKWEKIRIFARNWLFGPARKENSALMQSREYCRALSKATAGNFYRTFQLLDRKKSDAMCAIYAFMRITDDLVDDAPDRDTAKGALADWRVKTMAAFDQVFSHPIHPAFMDAVIRYKVPTQYFVEVMDGARMDLDVMRYQTFAELYEYCYRVASAVGLTCIHVWGYRNEAARKPAEAAGVALQLTNILRDIREDWERGRVYIPLEDLRRFGYTEEMLGKFEQNQQFQELMKFQIQRAREYYKSARELARYLRGNSRRIYCAILKTYEAILDRIEKNGFDVYGEKIRVSKLQKSWILCKSFLFSRC